MTKNQFLALKIGDRVRIRSAMWTMNNPDVGAIIEKDVSGKAPHFAIRLFVVGAQLGDGSYWFGFHEIERMAR